MADEQNSCGAYEMVFITGGISSLLISSNSLPTEPISCPPVAISRIGIITTIWFLARRTLARYCRAAVLPAPGGPMRRTWRTPGRSGNSRRFATADVTKNESKRFGSFAWALAQPGSPSRVLLNPSTSSRCAFGGPSRRSHFGTRPRIDRADTYL